MMMVVDEVSARDFFLLCEILLYAGGALGVPRNSKVLLVPFWDDGTNPLPC